MRTLTIAALITLHPEVFTVEAMKTPRLGYTRTEYRVAEGYGVKINNVAVSGFNRYTPQLKDSPEYFYVSAMKEVDGSCYMNITEDVDVEVTETKVIV